MMENTETKELSEYIDGIISNIPKLDSSCDYWLVRSNSGDYYTDFNINSYIGIAWNEISLKEIYDANSNTDRLKVILKDKMLVDENKGVSESVYGIAAGQILRFANNIKINDIVLVPSEGSQRFLVGKIISAPYEIEDTYLQKELDDELNYKKSNYKKRIDVKWLGWFNRSDADSALFKMIYTHNTLSIINEYKDFINRALFPYYIQDDKLYTTYRVTETNDIQGSYLGQFIYQYSSISMLLDPENRLNSKANVQSPGIVEFISNSKEIGIFVAMIVVGAITITYGGKVMIYGKEFSASGIFNSIKGYKNTQKNNQMDTDFKQLELLKKANEVAKELQVPISSLGIEFPEGLLEKIEPEKKDKNKA